MNAIVTASQRFPAKAENRGVVVTEAGSYLRLIDSCITQLKAQGSSRTFNESEEEEEEDLQSKGGREGVKNGGRERDKARENERT